MAGHSKWANIKHRKGRQDSLRGKLFSKISKEITIAARHGVDPEKNTTLADVLERARAANVPKDNIERAIKRATGELPGMQYEETIYEGYGPYGVAVMVRVVTDNKNRAVSLVRKTFEEFGGSLQGSVAWLFERRGVLTVKVAPQQDHDELLMKAIDLGAEDMEERDDEVQIYCPAERMAAVKEGLKQQGVVVERAEATLVPKTTVPLVGREAEKIIKFIEKLDDQEDVQEVFANFDVPEELLAQVG
ncbi:MAG: transcriptional regulator [Candidatus Fraserbacteria bacterium RBG_16_55_9]|uniref:Probable transcriptional regulatory protein A2Z21_05240 n=1 Tax=Fraserbacteria sp. (strain RBG_16_55_9) TaxID=1817864 RepID=A0A1F5US42_FRAXR|nr:MAG: transcriptional regulator [Candidatus Fraserbacteria bacterium RBG_16_55_9]